MSEVKVNKISPRSGTTVTLGDSGDTFTIPAGVSITNSGTASGFGSTGEVSWVTTKKTATFTATAGEGYFCDTSGGAFTVNLPAGTAGNSFAVADYTNTFQTNNLTISPNGSQKIGGEAQDAVLSTEGQSAYFVYVDDTEGWKNVIDSTSNITGQPPFVTATGGTITESGNCKIHTFTGPGTFSVSAVSNCAANNVVSYMVVAGGGGGGWDRAGGGGAGGFREVKSPVTPYTASPLDGHPSAPNRVTVTATSFPITVGAGGAGGTDTQPGKGTSGANSIFSTITSAGGGGGGSAPTSQPGLAGGSGGGSSGPGTGGAGNTPPVSPAQGSAGGDTPGALHGGGGGGATAAGNPGVGPLNPGTTAANGGAGATTSITTSPVTRAGGGGGGFSSGGSGCSPFPGGQPGPGGGGAGGPYPGGLGSAGSVNTGGGGGGGSNIPNASPAGNGGAGGSGIVVIRYKFQ